MPEGERTPISIYLTPRASMVLKQYSMGSGYGSVSRTVEEIILAFDFVYNSVKDTMRYVSSKASEKKPASDSDRRAMLAVLFSSVNNVNNAVSRLNKESTLPS